MNPKIFPIVVTYNRKELLQRCLTALGNQTACFDRLMLIDNASSDGTQPLISQLLSKRNSGEPEICYARLEKNLGGAGGFSEGIRRAIELGAEWVWIMDDDAEPLEDAVERLLAVADDPRNVYGSLAINGDLIAWPTTLLMPEPIVVQRVSQVPPLAEVESLPFLGFMIHRDLVAKIGLPDAGFFIAADDAEYCMRARHIGARIFVAGESRILHPKADSYVVRIGGRNIICLRLPPWKRYYDTRNRLLIARKHFGFRIITQTLPSLAVRLMATLVCEPRKAAQSWAFMAGLVDGLLKLEGKRHQFWKIPQ